MRFLKLLLLSLILYTIYSTQNTPPALAYTGNETCNISLDPSSPNINSNITITANCQNLDPNSKYQLNFIKPYGKEIFEFPEGSRDLSFYKTNSHWIFQKTFPASEVGVGNQTVKFEQNNGKDIAIFEYKVQELPPAENSCECQLGRTSRDHLVTQNNCSPSYRAKCSAGPPGNCECVTGETCGQPGGLCCLDGQRCYDGSTCTALGHCPGTGIPPTTSHSPYDPCSGMPSGTPEEKARLQDCRDCTGIDPTDTDPDPPTGTYTAIGCIPTEPQAFVSVFIKWAISVGGGIAFLLIIYGAFTVITAAGEPEKLKAGQETITSAITGILFIIFAIFLLRFISIDLFKIPGFISPRG